MFKKSACYFTLALSLVVLTASARTATAQLSNPCTDPSTGCVVGGTDPQPMVVGGTDPQPMVVGGTDPQPMVVGGTDPQPMADGSDDGLDDLIAFLLFYYGLS